MGNEWGTVQRLEVVGVDPEKNLMLLRGSVPGANGTCVSVYKTTRPKRAKKAVAASAKKASKAPAKAAKPEKK
jgi:large subunit ribosomal protein L3